VPFPRTSELTVVATAAVLLAIGGVIAAIAIPPVDDSWPPGSSFSYSPSGSAAAYLTLRAVGFQVERSFEPAATLTRPPASTVLIIAAPGEPASNQDRRAIQTFLAEGGTVLAAGCAGATFFSSAADAVSDASPPVQHYDARTSSPLTARAPSIAMTSGCRGPALGPGATPLYGRGNDAVVVASRIGKGLAVWWAGTTPIENWSIESPGQLELLLNVLGAGRVVVWDEFYHGQRRSLWAYLSRTPLPWAAAQIGLAAVVAAAAFVRRRAPIRTPFTASRTSPLEFVETMAGLYSRAASAPSAVALAKVRLRRLLLEATGLPATATDARLAAASSVRVSVPPADLETLLEAADRAARDPATAPQSALPLVRRMQQIAASVQGA